MKKLLYIAISISMLLYGQQGEADLLDTAFQPSKNLEQVINIGNSKNAVGNEVFRGSSELALFDKQCYSILNITPQEEEMCLSSEGKRDTDTCYNSKPLNYNNKTSCEDNEGKWKQFGGVIKPRDPLIVRITKTLLRITIALAIPMIIFIGTKTIISAINGEDYGKSFKEVLMVIAGLVLALSAIGLIYLIQSIALHSLSGSSPVG